MTAPASGTETLLVSGAAARLQTAGVGTFKTSSAYAVGDVAIVDGELPLEPECAIALMAYGVSDDPSLSDSVIGLQVTSRWSGEDPRPARDLDAAVFNVLHAAQHMELTGGVHVIQCQRQSGPASLGRDDNRRYRYVSNYYCTVHRPSTNRT